ncbi:3201_t:CDS:2, partial [Racocetra fulgida]
MEANQNIALFLQLLSNPALLQQTLAAVTQNSQSTMVPTSSEPMQTLLALSSAITKKPEEDWKEFLQLPHDTYWSYQFKNDFPTFPVSVKDFVLQKICENIVRNWEAHFQSIAPPPKCKNAIPPPPRLKKTTPPQSLVTNSDLGDIDDEIDTQLIASNENESPSRHDSFTSSTNIDESESPTITPRKTKSLVSLKIFTQPSTARSNPIEVDSADVSSDNDASELLPVAPHTMRSSKSSNIPTGSSATSSNANNTSALGVCGNIIAACTALEGLANTDPPEAILELNN